METDEDEEESTMVSVLSPDLHFVLLPDSLRGGGHVT